MLATIITRILEWLYPFFRRLMPKQTFMYAACGGGNTLLGIFAFFFSYNFVFKKELVHLPFITFTPHIAAMIVSFLITFPIGFYMARYVVFSGSVLRGRHQLVRYFATATGSVILNYINLKIMVDKLQFYPTIAQVINTVIVVAFSYLMQKYFAFKTNAVES
ncbi:MAG: GtrA family protein [Bacteroidota bacterium]